MEQEQQQKCGARTKPHGTDANRVLVQDGNAVQAHYLVEMLTLLMRYGTLRTHGIAFGMFPNRTKEAAIAATRRVVANAKKKGYIEEGTAPTRQHRYYALSKAGAAYLRDNTIEVFAEPTAYLLKKLTRAHHREWTNLCAIAAVRGGLESYAENDFWGHSFRQDILANFEHVPDALTFMRLVSEPVALWHEFDLSRRSRRAPTRALKKGEVDKSGVKQFRSLIHVMRQRRYIEHNGKQHTLKLLMHCATPLIQRELEGFLAKYCQDNNVELRTRPGVFMVPFMSRNFGDLEIVFQLLPDAGSTDCVWHDTDDLPFQGSQVELDTDYNEQFLKSRR